MEETKIKEFKDVNMLLPSDILSELTENKEISKKDESFDELQQDQNNLNYDFMKPFDNAINFKPEMPKKEKNETSQNLVGEEAYDTSLIFSYPSKLLNSVDNRNLINKENPYYFFRDMSINFQNSNYDHKGGLDSFQQSPGNPISAGDYSPYSQNDSFNEQLNKKNQIENYSNFNNIDNNNIINKDIINLNKVPENQIIYPSYDNMNLAVNNLSMFQKSMQDLTQMVNQKRNLFHPEAQMINSINKTNRNINTYVNSNVNNQFNPNVNNINQNNININNNSNNNQIDNINYYVNIMNQKPNNVQYKSNKYLKQSKNLKASSNSNNKIYSNDNEYVKFMLNLPLPLAEFLCSSKGTKEALLALKKFKSETINLIINQLSNDISKIFLDQYANYFIQEVIKRANNEDIHQIINLIQKDIVKISKNSIGTFPLQELFRKMNNAMDKTIVLNSIKGSEIEMANNINSTFVLQSIIKQINDLERKDLNKIILDNYVNLSSNPNGTNLLKKFMLFTTIEKNKQKILKILAENCIKISQSPFGNYCIQYIYEIWKFDECQIVTDSIIDHIYALSINRFSSNVVGNSLKFFKGEKRNQLINKILFYDNNFSFLFNKYGRFIFRKALELVPETTQKFILFIILKMVNNPLISQKYKEDLLCFIEMCKV